MADLPVSIPEKSADDEAIDAVVREIGDLRRSTLLSYWLTLGQLVIHHLYGGDLAALRARGPKDASFRRLSERPDLSVSRSELSRAVRVTELCERVGRRSFTNLGQYHLWEIARIPEARQRRVLRLAERHSWTIARIRAEQTESRPARGGRASLPAFVKTLNAWGRVCTDDASFADLQAIDALSTEDATRLLGVLAAVRGRCDELESRLHGLLAGTAAVGRPVARDRAGVTATRGEGGMA